jgi:hypothetical protein
MTDRPAKAPRREREGSKAEALTFPESICNRCAKRRTIATKTSEFLMCTALPTKYPRQPVLHCPAFDPSA